MRKQNLFLCIAIAIPIVIAVLLIVKVNRDDKRNREAIAQLGRESMLLAPVQHEQLELLDFNLMNIARSEVGDVNGRQFVFSDSLKADKTIVIYISAYYCKDCVNFVLGHIGALNDKVSCDKVVVLADKYLPRDLHVFARTNGFENDFYLPKDEVLKNKMDKVGMPVMFVVDKNSGNVSHVFVPHKEVPEYFVEYIDIVTGYVCD